MSSAHVEPTAAERAAEVRRLLTGYRVSQALYVATQLGIADRLSDEPKTAEELAHETGAHAPSLVRLLRALAAYGVFSEVAPGRFALAPLGACLRADAPNSLRDVALAFAGEDFWRTWGDLLHCVRTGESATTHLFGTDNPFDRYAQDPELAAMMSANFAAGSRARAAAVAAAYDFSGGGTIVDVGGGYGQLLAAVLRAHPEPRGVLFDLPHVVAEAGPLLAAAGVADRCNIVPGDMFAEVPEGGDTYLFMSIIHDWDDARAIAILRNCQRAMRPDATILLIEIVLPVPVEPSPAAQEQTMGDLNMLVRTTGRERTEEEYRALFRAAGLTVADIIPTVTTHSLVCGKHPE